MKTCTKCGEAKPATMEYFQRVSSKQDSLRPYCKACTAKIKRAWYVENRQRATEYARTWHSENREHAISRMRTWRNANKTKRSEYQREWLAKNKDRVSEQRRIYRIANQGRISEYNRTYIDANRDKVYALNRRRVARKQAASGSHTEVDVIRQYKAQKEKCYYCHTKIGKVYHVDHVIPLSRGGSNGPENIVIACARCNQSKHDRLPHEWPQGNRLL